MTLNDNMRVPVRALLVKATLALEFILDQEWYDLGQFDRRFLAIGESGDLATGNEGATIGLMRLGQRARRVADQTERLARAILSLDQRYRHRVVGQIPQRCWPAPPAPEDRP